MQQQGRNRTIRITRRIEIQCVTWSNPFISYQKSVTSIHHPPIFVHPPRVTCIKNPHPLLVCGIVGVVPRLQMNKWYSIFTRIPSAMLVIWRGAKVPFAISVGDIQQQQQSCHKATITQRRLDKIIFKLVNHRYIGAVWWFIGTIPYCSSTDDTAVTGAVVVVEVDSNRYLL